MFLAQKNRKMELRSLGLSISNLSTATASEPEPMPKILIVEDNELSRDMLSRRLRRKGYEVLVATDGQEGIAMAQRELPDLVLMDLSLPDLDGWEATRRLKKDAKTQHIPVIALTAHAMSGDREKAIDAGCDEYDTKPIDLRRLLSKMIRFVEDPEAAGTGTGGGEKSMA